MPDLARLADALRQTTSYPQPQSGNAFSAGAAGAGGAPPSEIAENRQSACPATPDFAGAPAGAGGAQEEEPAPAAPALPRQVPRQSPPEKPQKTATFEGGAPAAPAAPAEKTSPDEGLWITHDEAPKRTADAEWLGRFSRPLACIRTLNRIVMRDDLPPDQRQPVSWADPLHLPLPGDWCSCCLGGSWWSLEGGARGWCCSTCHPPTGLETIALAVVRTRNLAE